METHLCRSPASLSTISLKTGRIQPSSITLTSRCLVPSSGRIYPHRALPTLKPAAATTGGPPEPGWAPWEPGAVAGGGRAPRAGAARPHARGQAASCTVAAITSAWAAPSSSLGHAWQLARAVNAQLLLCLNECSTLFFFFYCYARKILKWMEINVRHKYGWAAWLAGLHPPTDEHRE